jgi:hypothetical protein
MKRVVQLRIHLPLIWSLTFDPRRRIVALITALAIFILSHRSAPKAGNDLLFGTPLILGDLGSERTLIGIG